VTVNAHIVAPGVYDSAITEWDCKIRRAGSLGMLVHLADAVPEAINAAIDQRTDRPETQYTNTVRCGLHQAKAVWVTHWGPGTSEGWREMALVQRLNQGSGHTRTRATREAQTAYLERMRLIEGFRTCLGIPCGLLASRMTPGGARSAAVR
jgi:hypothetical protein